jgi:DNA-binding LacI/PurR family transcriptional regulator
MRSKPAKAVPTPIEPGEIVSLADFAKYLNLSAWTVSRAINGHPEVKTETRDRILEAMEATGFRPNPLARGLRGQKTGVIGVSVAGLSSPILNTKIYFLQEFLRKRQLRSLLEFSIRDPLNEARVIEDFSKVRVDGMILIYSGLGGDKARRMLNGVDCVHVDPHFPQSLPSVSLDRHLAMKFLLEHLLGLGHQRFALLGFNEQDPWRWPALMEVAKLHRLNPKEAFVPMGNSPLAEQAIAVGYAMAAEALRLPRPPTAFIGQDDLVAIGAIQAIKEARLDVPRDISVTGFDHLAMVSHLRPLLTTIEQNPAALMELAGQMLLDQLEGRSGGKSRRTVTPQLILGESTGPATSSAAVARKMKAGS